MQPPQYPYAPPPPPEYRPAQPKRSPWRWIGLLFAVLFVCLFLASSPDFRQGFMQGLKPMIDAQNNVQATANATPVDTAPAPAWTITSTFSGTGTSKTATFAVNGDWQINWYCSLPAGGTGQYHITIDVDRPGQKVPLEPDAVDAFCSSSVVSGSVEVQQTGTLYLAVTSATGWTAEIEQLI